MRHLLFLWVFLVGCEDVALPVAKQGVAVKGGPFVVHLSKQGQITVGPELVTLDGLAKKVRVSAVAAGFDILPGGAKGSKLHVLLRAYQAAVWQHVQWILTVLAQEKVYKTAFAVSTGKLVAHLPVDIAVGQPRNEIMVSIHIVARKEKPATFGPPERMQRVTMPTTVKYRFSDREVHERDLVAKWILEAKDLVEADEGDDVALVGEIKAGHKVPFHFVVGVLDEFHDAGLKTVRFYGTQIPTEALRRKLSLPYPRRNY